MIRKGERLFLVRFTLLTINSENYLKKKKSRNCIVKASLVRKCPIPSLTHHKLNIMISTITCVFTPPDRRPGSGERDRSKIKHI